MVLLPKLEFKLFDIGGGRAGGSFLMRPLRSTNKIRGKHYITFMDNQQSSLEG